MAIRKFTVARDDTRYQAWPDVAMTKSGRLVCVFTECDHHGDRTNSRIMMTFSDDRGRTWSEKTAVSEMSQKDYFFNCARISRIPDGTMLINADRSNEQDDNKAAVQYLWHCDENGENRQAPVIVDIDCIVPDRPLFTKDGAVLYFGHKKNVATGRLEQYCWRSDDGGKTWGDRITVAADPGLNLCEGSTIEMPTGELICFMRENSAKGLDCKKAISRDGGRSWEGIYDVPIPACHRPVAGFLNDGNVLITHRFMQGGKGWLGFWTQNVFAAMLPAETLLKTDRREQSARIMPLDYDRSPKSDLGYTGWVQFDDGEIYVVNYIVDDAPKAHIRGYSFYLEDILL